MLNLLLSVSNNMLCLIDILICHALWMLSMDLQSDVPCFDVGHSKKQVCSINGVHPSLRCNGGSALAQCKCFSNRELT